MAIIGKIINNVQAGRDMLYDTHKQLILEVSSHFSKKMEQLEKRYKEEKQVIRDMAEGDWEIMQSTPNPMADVICDFEVAWLRIREIEFCAIFNFYEIGIKNIICEYIKKIERSPLPNMLDLIRSYAKKNNLERLFELCDNKLFTEDYRHLRNYYSHMNLDSKDWTYLKEIFEKKKEPLFSVLKQGFETIEIPNDNFLLHVLESYYKNLNEIESEILNKN